MKKNINKMGQQIQTANQKSDLVGFQKAASETFSIVQTYLSPIEAELIKSFTETPTIGTLLNQKKNITDRFRQLCLTCMTVSGIKTEFDEVTEKFIYQYIINNHKNYTFEEIEKAFYFNSIGELQTRHEHFGSFDTTFFSKVMIDWLILKTKTRNHAASLLPAKIEKTETDEESYNGLVEYCKKHGSMPEMWSWSKVYNYMDECLMIEETLEQKHELFEQVERQIKNKLTIELLKVKSGIERQRRLDELPTDVKTECRKIMIKKYLKF